MKGDSGKDRNEYNDDILDDDDDDDAGNVDFSLMISWQRSERPIRAPPRLSAILPRLPSKQYYVHVYETVRNMLRPIQLFAGCCKVFFVFFVCVLALLLLFF